MVRLALELVEDVRAYAVAAWNRFGPALGVTGDQDHADTGSRDLAARLVERLHPPRMKLRLKEVLDETPSTRTLRFERTDGPLPPFRAGQYVNLFVDVGGVKTSRPFSISSAPGEEFVDLTVRRRDGGFVTAHLFNGPQVGEEFVSSAPAGWFCHEPLIDGDDLVFIAGGSGVTPFISMLRDFERRRPGVRVRLLYGTRTMDDVPFADELLRLEGALKGLKVTHVYSEASRGYRGAKGLLDAKRIGIHVPVVEGRRFFLCGPNPMLDLCRTALAQLGVPAYRVRTELYGPPDDPTLDPDWPDDVAPADVFPVDIEGGRRVMAKAEESLLVAFERHGVVVPSICRSGECSACRMQVLKGRVFMPGGVGVRESDRANGFVHACVAYPVSPLTVKL